MVWGLRLMLFRTDLLDEEDPETEVRPRPIVVVLRITS